MSTGRGLCTGMCGVRPVAAALPAPDRQLTDRVAASRQRLARGRDNWSLGELLQALTVLAHYHALCSFVLGCRALDAKKADTDSETEGEWCAPASAGHYWSVSV